MVVDPVVTCIKRRESTYLTSSRYECIGSMPAVSQLCFQTVPFILA